MSSVMQSVLGEKRALGIPGVNRKWDDRKKVRQEEAIDLSVGRHNPVFPQSISTQKCIASLPPSCGEPNVDP